MESFTTVQVREELSLTALVALYWDSLANETADGDELNRPIRLIQWSYVEYTSPAVVRERVRQWLGWYGSRSVECGPRVEIPEIEGFKGMTLEESLRVIVARAFKLDR